jgi:DNA (cytosine-5)-methyltransferase 1
VFVVAHFGKGNLAAKVLFESESVRRDTPPSREARQGVAADVEECARSINQRIDAGIPDVCATIDCVLAKQVGKQLTQQAESFYFPIPIHDQATRFSGKRGEKQDGKGNGLGVGKPGDPCPTLTKGDKHAVLYENHPNDSRVTGPHDVAPSCVSRYGTGGGNVPLVQEAIAFEPGIATREGNESRFVKELSPTLRKEMGDNQVAIAMRESGQGYWMEDNKAGTLRAEGENRPSRPSNVIAEPVAVDTYNHALQEKAVPIRSTASDICHTGGVINPADRMAVRRLTPKECERLQGFNDDHTLIPWRNKPADQCPDGPRYKALGNSMAVPCMAWIGKRIDAVKRNNRKEHQ